MAFHFGTGFCLGIILLPPPRTRGSLCELLITTMMFVFGAGTIETRRGARRIVSAISAGSLIGAALGGIAVGFAPVGAIKVILGCVLMAAAAKVAVSKH